MRKKLVMALVYAMREAENIYLERPEFVIKGKIYDIVANVKLTKAENILFYNECNALGI